MTSRELHDWLMANRPDGAEHKADECPYCSNPTGAQEGDVTAEDRIFTQEQHEQLLRAAVEKATTEATAKTDAEVLRLNEQLSQAQEQLAAKDAQIAELQKKIADREEQDRLEALAEERVKLVQAEVNFSEEQLEARKMSWARMEESEFAALLEDYKAAAAAAKSPGTQPQPAATKLHTVRATAGENGTEKSVLSDFFSGSALAVAEKV